jgi:hypothetical protein
LTLVDSALIRRALGLSFQNSFVFLPAIGTRGGIIVAVKDSTLQLSNPVLTNHTISVLVVDARSNSSWSFIADYGPQGELEKKDVYKGVKAAYAAKPDKVVDNGGF